jgi:hypothetical protein
MCIITTTPVKNPLGSWDFVTDSCHQPFNTRNSFSVLWVGGGAAAGGGGGGGGGGGWGGGGGGGWGGSWSRRR